MEHHERPDGKGYPSGLAGDQIALQSRIVGISDALDAMTSTRPYRKGLPLATALELLEEGAGSQFDPVLVEHMCELGRAGDLSHIVGHSAEGIPVVTCPTCGPVIAVPRTARDGDIVFCRACTGELTLHKTVESFEAELTGMARDAFDLQPHLNGAAIEDLMRQVLETMEY